MTRLPPPSAVKLGLVIDLDTCVGCHACAVACKEWNAAGIAGPLTDEQPYGAEPSGVWFNRVHSYELEALEGLDDRAPQPAMTLHFPRSCLHCETPACVTVCPTGASYKRAEDGIVLVDEDKCIGCKLCSWACPYGAREYSEVEGVMKKCTLCVDRIYNESLPEHMRQPACVQACPTRARRMAERRHQAQPDPDAVSGARAGGEEDHREGRMHQRLKARSSQRSKGLSWVASSASSAGWVAAAAASVEAAPARRGRGGR